MGRDVLHDAGGACEPPATAGISITFGPESMAIFVFYSLGGQKGSELHAGRGLQE